MLIVLVFHRLNYVSAVMVFAVCLVALCCKLLCFVLGFGYLC